MSRPIDPGTIDDKKAKSLPEEVFEAFNKLIEKNWNGTSATVNQDEVADLVASSMDITRAEVFTRHLLDVERAYRKAGWKVEYDKPAYCETYAAHFIFRK